MNKKKIKVLIFLFLVLLPLIVKGQPSKTFFVNTGKMYVSGNDKALLYILGSVRVLDGISSVSIVQEGVMKLTGHFCQDSNGHVFAVDGNGYGTSKGTICFFDLPVANDDPSGGSSLLCKRVISSDSLNFDRSGKYVAFPTVKIDMNKPLVLPEYMSADMDALKADASQPDGKLWLKSATTVDEKVYDASLRFPKRNEGETDTETAQSVKAPPGKIIVERDIVPYRGNVSSESVIFPFATPFYSTQLSGYFAGNWIRRPESDNNHHTGYPYGDRIDPSKPGNFIAREQYITDPREALVPGQAYLIKPLGTSEFDDLPADFPEYGLQITGAGNPNPADYKKTLFVFDGSVYKLPDYDEQLNLLPIFDATVSSRTDSTVNILIGNSYTSAIDLEKISNYMIDHPTLYFNRYIYVYSPRQATPYMAYDAYQHVWGQEIPPVLLTESTVPGMGVFMLRLVKTRISSGRVTIDRTFLTHGNNSHNLKSSKGFYNEVLFTLTYDSYPRLQDLSAIGFRKGSRETFESLDVPRFSGKTITVPVLYTLSSDNIELSSNSIPEGAQSVRLCVKSGLGKTEKCTLQVSRQESMNTGYLVLEDKVTNRFINLYEQDSYSFELTPQESIERFVLHFVKPSAMSMEETNVSPLKLYYNRQLQTLDVTGLTDRDKYSGLVICDLQGRILKREGLKESHAIDYLPEGVYIAKVTGERNVALKFSK